MMKKLFPVLFPFVLVYLISGAQPNSLTIKKSVAFSSRADEIDMDRLLSAASTPICTRKCTSQLIIEFKNILLFNNTFDKVDTLCQEYESALTCVTHRSCPFNDIFKIATSGLATLCSRNVTNFLGTNAKCLRENMDENVQFCDKHCLFTQTCARFTKNLPSHGGNILRLVKDAGPNCLSLRCFMKCIRIRLDRACPSTGTVIIESLAEPFYYFADYLSTNASPSVKNFIRSKLPVSCADFGKQSVIDAIVGNS